MSPSLKFSVPVTVSALMLLSYSTSSSATPFSECPEEAFIVQTTNNTPKAYGVDMSTGSYSTLSSDLGTNDSFNGVGYNEFDDYIYGWDYVSGKLKRFGSDYVISGFGQINKVDSASQNAGNFFVGDIATTENAWYGYRKTKGLFRIGLDGSAPYSMSKVAGSGSPTWNIADMAFHPSDGFIYGVTTGSTGKLIKIDPSDGSITNLGTVIEHDDEGSFTFGAQFFDADGNMYISNNGDGKVYKINIDAVTSTLFAFGPSSSSNDGARCANAPISVGSNVDFGDAPDTYGTTMTSNGARHTITADNYLGSNGDNETDGQPYPMSDDSSDGTDDEDGITMPTGFEKGETALLVAELNGLNSTAYLNAWVDWNGNGTFEASELTIDDEVLTTGNNNINITVPLEAEVGDTWARFRVSDTQDITATGGVGNGEVEDYEISVTETGITEIYYPSSSTYTSLAFEDLFPTFGDFDLNDVVKHVRYTEYVKLATPTWTEGNTYYPGDIVQYSGNTYECLLYHIVTVGAGWYPTVAPSLWTASSEPLVSENKVRRVKFESQLAAMGAAYHNGFAIMLEGVSRSSVAEDAISWSIDGVTQASSPLEAGQTNAVIVFADDLWDYVTLGEGGCTYLRTEPGCGTSDRVEWSITVPFNTEITDSAMPEPPYSAFIFAAENHGHGGNLPASIIANPHRSWEVHLKNNQPSDTFLTDLFGTFDDDSAGANTFQNVSGLPYGIEVPATWRHPREGISILDVYSQFANFAADPSGTTNPTWYLDEHADTTKTFND